MKITQSTNVSELGRRRQKGCRRVLEKMMVIDAYGPPVPLMLPNNKQRYKSTLGGLLTLLVILISVSYSVFKGQLLASSDLNKI